MKLYDFDSIFDEKLTEYMTDNMSKHSEKEWETLIPKLYQEFADTVLEEIKMSPTDYYLSMTNDELIATLKEHILQDIAVSDILCSAIEARGCESQLISLLDEKGELLKYAVSMLGANEKTCSKYLKILQECNDTDLEYTIVDLLKDNADLIKDDVIQIHKTNKNLTKDMLEIMSRCKVRDDEIYNILIKEFKQNIEDMTMYVSFLAEYGDERALPILMAEISREDINYVEFQELVYAIEKLGGEYKQTRDFSNDPFFKAITSGVKKDIFNN